MIGHFFNDCIVFCMENYFEDELELNWMILDRHRGLRNSEII